MTAPSTIQDILYCPGANVILIKKYPNRRLYDTSKSRYINIEAIKALVVLRKEFKVIDSKTEADLTKSILMQIIAEQEVHEDQSVLSAKVLTQLICCQRDDVNHRMRDHLEHTVEKFLESQGDGMQSIRPEPPVNGFFSGL